ncbi:MAG: DUF748 domain-containing protein [Myxococcaceae bacterium]|nr:DUF748 domain-containing protein [Myxococcaceae bacterium]
MAEPAPPRPWWRKKRVRIPLALLALYTLLGFVVLPRVLEAKLPEKLSPVLKRPVTVGKIRFNPFALELEVHDFSVTEKDGAPFVAFRALTVNASFFALLRGRVGFDAIALDGLRASVTLLRGGALSFADLLEPDPAAPPPPPPSKSEPVTVSIAALKVSDGAFTFRDLTGVQPFTAQLEPLALELQDFTTETGKGSTYAFKAKLGAATLDYEGDFSARPLKSAGRLSMQGIRLPVAQPYVAGLTQLELLEGVLGVSARYTLDGSAEPLQLALHDAKVTLDGLKVGGVGEAQPVFELAQLEVTAPTVDVAAKHAEVSALVLKGGTVRARREKGGQVQLVRLASRPKGGAADVVDAGAPDPAPVAATPAPAPAPAPAQKPGWSVALGRFALEQWALHWADQSLEYPVALDLDQLDLVLPDLKWPEPRPIDASLSFRWQETGTVSLSGPVTLEPPGAALALKVKDLNLKPIDGYLWDSGLNLTLQQGVLGAALELKASEGGKRLAVKGDVNVEQLALLDGDDKPLMELRALGLQGLDLQSAPAVQVSLEALKLAGLKLRVEKDAKGVLNLSQLSRAPAAPPVAPAPPAAEGPPPTAAIKALVVDDLNVDWLDKTTSPPFATALSKLTGKLTQVTYPVKKPVGVALGARLDQAPLRIGGTVLPLGKAPLVDLTVSLEGYDLSHATPYSVQYVAQPINAGKLGLDVKAKLASRKLDSSTHVIVDLLEFGEKVANPGPDATSLPLGLAVAVLSDRNGRIDLELPILGDQDDPDFRWGGVLWKVLTTLMEKVATAPFALLGNLLGGADPEVLKLIAFAPGQSVATGDEAKKLDTLASLLKDRPQLKLELTPGADEVTDRDALRHRALERSLTARTGQGAVADGGTPVLAREDYERLATTAWKKLAVGRPDAGSVPFAEMEAELLARQVVAPEELAELGRDRVAWCQAGLEERGVSVTRVFSVQPEGGKGARAQVDIGLR